MACSLPYLRTCQTFFLHIPSNLLVHYIRNILHLLTWSVSFKHSYFSHTVTCKFSSCQILFFLSLFHLFSCLYLTYLLPSIPETHFHLLPFKASSSTPLSNLFIPLFFPALLSIHLLPTVPDKLFPLACQTHMRSYPARISLFHHLSELHTLHSYICQTLFPITCSKLLIPCKSVKPMASRTNQSPLI
jgi:hypothetical protein